RQMFVVDGGSDRLPRALTDGLDARIRYNAPVVRIAHGSDGVAATYLDEGTPRTIDGTYLICTIPFPVLRGIAVEPAFSAEKGRAIDELSTTAVTRVFLQARTRFWEEQGLPATAGTDCSLGVCTDVTALQPGPHGIIESYQAGAYARRTSALSLPEQLAQTGVEMERIYPGIAAACDGGAAYAWHEDEWARGGYAWSRPGQMAALEPHIGTPEGRVFFAGDHASPWPGWMQGALWSGLRAARAIMATS
ncbi:MAG: flavin monoamine oxidase family protein, partial [Dehalococcoidia bacterium]